MLGRYTSILTHLTIALILLGIIINNSMSPIKLDSPTSSAAGSEDGVGSSAGDVAVLLRTMDFAARVSSEAVETIREIGSL
jgi:hypothetical protein